MCKGYEVGSQKTGEVRGTLNQVDYLKNFRKFHKIFQVFINIKDEHISLFEIDHCVNCKLKLG